MGTGLLLAALALLALAALLILAHGTAPAPTPAKPVKPAKPAPPTITPREFEQHCADALAARGWSVTLGRGSADQGVDVFARKGGRSVVLQCKLYTRPVGNKAVQEALAGRGYAGADGAAVVSNAPYTPAAHALAARVGVLLLHTADLARADTLFQFPATPPPSAEPTRARRAPSRRARTWRLRLPRPTWALPALALAALILLVPRLAPNPPERRQVASPSLPLPPPSPPQPPRRASPA
ncbi:restriction endonuclease [Roseomonas sp. WA12]